LPRRSSRDNVYGEKFAPLPTFGGRVDEGIKVEMTDDKDKLLKDFEAPQAPRRERKSKRLPKKLRELLALEDIASSDADTDRDQLLVDLEAALARRQNATNSSNATAPVPPPKKTKWWKRLGQALRKAGRGVRNLFGRRRNRNNRRTEQPNADLVEISDDLFADDAAIFEENRLRSRPRTRPSWWTPRFPRVSDPRNPRNIPPQILSARTIRPNRHISINPWMNNRRNRRNPWINNRRPRFDIDDGIFGDDSDLQFGNRRANRRFNRLGRRFGRRFNRFNRLNRLNRLRPQFNVDLNGFDMDKFFRDLDKTNVTPKAPKSQKDDLDRIMEEVNRELHPKKARKDRKKKVEFVEVDIEHFFADRKPSKTTGRRGLAIEVVDNESEAWSKFNKKDSEKEGVAPKKTLTRRERLIRKIRRVMRILGLEGILKPEDTKKVVRKMREMDDGSNDDDLAEEFFKEHSARRWHNFRKNRKNRKNARKNARKARNAKNHSSKTVFDASHLGTSGMFGHFAEDSTPNRRGRNGRRGSAMFGSISRPGTSAMFGNVDPSANNEVVYRVPKVRQPNAKQSISAQKPAPKPRKERKPVSTVYPHGGYVPKKYNGNGRNSGLTVGMVTAPGRRIRVPQPRQKVAFDDTTIPVNSGVQVDGVPVTVTKPTFGDVNANAWADVEYVDDRVGDFNDLSARNEPFVGDDVFLSQEDRNIDEEARAMSLKRAAVTDDAEKDDDMGVTDDAESDASADDVEDFDIEFEKDADSDFDDEEDYDLDADFEFDDEDDSLDYDDEDVDEEAVDEDDIDVEFDQDDDFDEVDTEDVDDEADLEDADEDDDVDNGASAESNEDDDLNVVINDADEESDNEVDVAEEDLDADADIDADLADFNDADDDADDADFNDDVSDDDLARK